MESTNNLRTVNTSVKMPPALHERVKALAESRRSTSHAVMLQAIETFLEREEKREKLRKAALAAHEHYKLTGLHLTQAEIENWVESIAKGERKPLPPCHV